LQEEDDLRENIKALRQELFVLTQRVHSLEESNRRSVAVGGRVLRDPYQTS
jgi:hypothetical protein